jgi:hypothetical protein
MASNLRGLNLEWEVIATAFVRTHLLGDGFLTDFAATNEKGPAEAEPKCVFSTLRLQSLADKLGEVSNS